MLQVAYRKAFLQRRNTARSALGSDANKWINDPTSEDEVELWGEMFILSEKDPGAANDDTLQKVSEPALRPDHSDGYMISPLSEGTGVAPCVDRREVAARHVS